MIKISIISDGTISGTKGKYREVLQKGKIEFYNTTKHDALDIDLIWGPTQPAINLQPMKFRHIKGLERLTLTFSCEIKIPLDELAKDKNIFANKFPCIFPKHSLVLKYSNEMHKKFFSLLQMNDTGIRCSYHRKFPRQFKECVPVNNAY